jgi:hypothetical protein
MTEKLDTAQPTLKVSDAEENPAPALEVSATQQPLAEAVATDALPDLPEESFQPSEPFAESRTRRIHPGLLRHQLIVGSCVMLSAMVLVLSLIDLSSLIRTRATIDNSLQVVRKSIPELPPDVHFMRANEYSAFETNKADVEFNDGLAPVEVSTWGGTKFGYVDRSGKMVIAPLFAQVQPFSEGLAAVQPTAKEAHWGFIDTTGRMVIPPDYSTVDAFHNGAAPVTFSDLNHGLISKTGVRITKQPLIKCEWAGGMFVGGVDGEHLGLLNSQGEWALRPDFAQVENQINSRHRHYVRSYWLLESPANDKAAYYELLDGSGWTLADSSGKLLFPSRFQEILGGGSDHFVVKTDNAYGIVDKSGAFVVQPKYDDITAFGDLIGVRKNGKWALLTSDGKPISMKTRFNGIIYGSSHEWFSDGLAPVIIGKKCGYINKTGDVVIGPQFDYAMPFKEGRAAVFKNGYWQFLDSHGMLHPQKYASISSFNDGLANVVIPGPLYGFALARDMENLVRNLDSSKEGLTNPQSSHVE